VVCKRDKAKGCQLLLFDVCIRIMHDKFALKFSIHVPKVHRYHDCVVVQYHERGEEASDVASSAIQAD
jgi:hypothetical protein